MESFERFSIYGFALDYPEACRVEFNAKNRRESGDVAFHFPSPDRVRIFLSWGELEKVTKRFKTTQEHAEYSLNAMKQGKNVKNFELVSRDSLGSQVHRGTVNKVKFDEMTTGMFFGKRGIPREAYSLHVHCENSNRYFVLYSMAPSSVEGRYDKIMAKMRDSFKCH
jgi:hypothetical protein